MKYAVIQFQGKQYRVQEGDEFQVDRLEEQSGSNIKTDQVLLLQDDDSTHIGQPLVEGAQVTLEVLSEEKGDKIRVATFKAKSRQRKVRGFRPLLSKVRVQTITLN